MIDMISVGAIYFGAACAVCAVLCVCAAILERFPRFTDKLCRVIFPESKKKAARYGISCSYRCPYYGTLLVVGDEERVDFCYKYNREAAKGCPKAKKEYER